jgi:hypothetical protein
MVAVQDPFLGFRVLEVDKDPVCFSLWEGQPVDSSQLRASVQVLFRSVLRYVLISFKQLCSSETKYSACSSLTTA